MLHLCVFVFVLCFVQVCVHVFSVCVCERWHTSVFSPLHSPCRVLPRASRQLEAHIPQATMAFAAGSHDPRSPSSGHYHLCLCVRECMRACVSMCEVSFSSQWPLLLAVMTHVPPPPGTTTCVCVRECVRACVRA